MPNTPEGTPRRMGAGGDDGTRRVVEALDARLRAVLDRPHAAIRRCADRTAAGFDATEPDLAVVEGESPDAARLLAIDVTRGASRPDVRARVAAYARAHVAEVWIIDLEGPVLEAHRRLVGERYAEVVLLGPNDTAQSPALGPSEIALVDILRTA